MKYRKKPIEIEAMQYTDDTYDTYEVLKSLHEFMAQKELTILYKEPNNPKIVIPTLEGDLYASIGDYIIKGIKGELYPCKPDIFEATYERVKE